MDNYWTVLGKDEKSPPVLETFSVRELNWFLENCSTQMLLATSDTTRNYSQCQIYGHGIKSPDARSWIRKKIDDQNMDIEPNVYNVVELIYKHIDNTVQIIKINKTEDDWFWVNSVKRLRLSDFDDEIFARHSLGPFMTPFHTWVSSKSVDSYKCDGFLGLRKLLKHLNLTHG